MATLRRCDRRAAERLVALFASAILTTACSTATPTTHASGPPPGTPIASSAETLGLGGSEGPSSTIGPADLFTAPAAPLDVTPVLATSNSVKATIGQDGGSLTAKAADGTTYTLAIPKNAVLFKTDVAMTPVTDIGGLPMGVSPTNRIGVQLQPDGLELFTPATLTITPSKPLPDTGAATIDWLGQGTDAGLRLSRLTSTTITLTVEHFSGYGAFWPLDQTWWTVFQSLQARQYRRLESEMIKALEEVRQQQLLGRATVTLDEVALAFKDRWMREVLQPRLVEAHLGCTEAVAAVVLYRTWEQQRQELGSTDEALVLPIPDWLLTLERDLCFEEEFLKCAATGDFEGLMGFFGGFFRQYELFGDVPPADAVELAQLYLERCGRWTLTVEQIDDTRATNTGAHVVSHTKSTFLIKWRPGTGNYGLYGSEAKSDPGKIEVLSVTATAPGCSIRISGITQVDGGTAEIRRILFDRPDEDAPVPRSLQLVFYPGSIEGTWVENCSGLVDTEPWGDYMMSSLVIALRENAAGEMVVPASAWLFEDGPLDNGPFSATYRKAAKDTFGGPVRTDVELEVILLHTPAV
jgi:hypothetical protein